MKCIWRVHQNNIFTIFACFERLFGIISETFLDFFVTTVIPTSYCNFGVFDRTTEHFKN